MKVAIFHFLEKPVIVFQRQEGQGNGRGKVCCRWGCDVCEQLFLRRKSLEFASI